jgi:RND family efflux transporter MFP subunit
MTIACFRRSSALIFAVAALAVAGCDHSADTGKTKEAPRVTVAHPAVRSLVDEDDYNGWLVASQTVEVRARVRGHIQKIHFKDGDMVKEGQPLFDLDPDPFMAELNQVEAQARALEAQEVAMKKVVERNRILITKAAVSQQDLEKSEADAQSIEAQIVATRAEAEKHRLDVKYSKITAPIAGRIGRAMLTEGNLVNAGGSDPLLTTIVAIDPIYVDFNVDERAMQRYQQIGASRGQEDRQRIRDQKLPFAFGLDTEEGYPHQGQIIFADNKYTEGTGTILVRGLARNPDGRLVAGSRVRVRVPVSDQYQAAVVPDTAVLSDMDRRYLLVLGKDNVVLRRDVTPGRLLDDGMRVILPAPDEKKSEDWARSWEKNWVITVGLQRARIDYPVLPLDASGQPISTK